MLKRLNKAIQDQSDIGVRDNKRFMSRSSKLRRGLNSVEGTDRRGKVWGGVTCSYYVVPAHTALLLSGLISHLICSWHGLGTNVP